MKSHLLLLALACLLATVLAAPLKFGSGVNLAGLEFTPGTVPGTAGTNFFVPTSNEVDYYYNLGLRHFRVPFLWERLQRTLGGDFDPTYVAYLDTLINYILGKGCTVVIDPHNYARYNGNIVGASGSGVTQEHLLNLWTRLGARYGSHEQTVIFGLMNEPKEMSTSLWWSVAQFVVNGIRTAGYKNTVAVPGNGWTGAHSWNQNWYSSGGDGSNAFYAATFQDSLNNTVFEVHQYFDGDYSGTSSSCTTSTTAAAILSDFETFLSNNYAYGYVGEFAGSTESACETIVKAALARFKANDRIKGTSWWAGGPQWGSYMFLFETANLQGTVTQMGWQTAQLIAYERSDSSTPGSASTPTASPTASPVASTPTASPVASPSPSGGSTPSAAPSAAPSAGSTPSVGSTPSDSESPSAGTPTDGNNSPSNNGSSLVASWAFLVALLALLF